MKLAGSAELQTVFPPSAGLLRELCRCRIDDEMLIDIARADDGQMAEEAFEELLLIRDFGTLPESTSSIVNDVLNLSRWRDPDRP